MGLSQNESFEAVLFLCAEKQKAGSEEPAPCCRI